MGVGMEWAAVAAFACFYCSDGVYTASRLCLISSEVSGASSVDLKTAQCKRSPALQEVSSSSISCLILRLS